MNSSINKYCNKINEFVKIYTKHVYIPVFNYINDERNPKCYKHMATFCSNCDTCGFDFDDTCVSYEELESAFR